MSKTFEDELTKLARRMSPGEQLTYASPLGKALEAVAFCTQLDRVSGRPEVRYPLILERVRQVLSPNATPFEIGLSVGIAMAVATEGFGS